MSIPVQPFIRSEITKYGFNWGAASVERMANDLNKGWVSIAVNSPKPKESLSIYVTKTGKIRVWKNGVELK